MTKAAPDMSPRPPAAAYAVVVELLGSLADDYLTTPPPDNGVRLAVVGEDNVQTQWDVGHKLAAILLDRLTKDRRIRRAVGTSYGESAAA